MIDQIKELGSLEFKSRVVKETVYGVVDDYGDVDNVMKLCRLNDYMFIDWEVGDGIDGAEIGITAVGHDITDYDGVFELPNEAIQLLKKCGFNTEEIED